MDITPEDARRSLDAIDEAVTSHRRAIDREASHIVLAWGVTYLVAPLCVHFWPQGGLIAQQLLVVIAIAFTIYFTSRGSSVSGPSVRRFGIVWGIVYGFSALWFCMLSPLGSDDPAARFTVTAEQMWAYGVTLAMMIYIVAGLWVGRFYVVLGIVVTLATAFGLFFLGEWFWLWSSLSGGGAMLAAGMYLRKVSGER